MCCRHSVSPSKQITPFLEARDSRFSGVRLWGGHRPNPPAVVAMGSWQEFAFTAGDVSVSVSDTDFIENNDFLQNPAEKRTLLRPFLGPVFICISAREAAGGKGACSGILRGLRWEEWLGAERPEGRPDAGQSLRLRARPHSCASRSLSVPQLSRRRTKRLGLGITRSTRALTPGHPRSRPGEH